MIILLEEKIKEVLYIYVYECLNGYIFLIVKDDFNLKYMYLSIIQKVFFFKVKVKFGFCKVCSCVSDIFVCFLKFFIKVLNVEDFFW